LVLPSDDRSTHLIVTVARDPFSNRSTWFRPAPERRTPEENL
jgi:hypothetical protein